MKKHWQDWGNLVLGLWVFISPWFLQQITATGAEAGSAATSSAVVWNLYIVGIAIAALAGTALFAFQAWEEWTNLALGAWLFASPWVLGFSSSALLMWNAVIVGALVVALAGWALSPTQDSEQGPTKHA
jgi:hypothetical protein